MNNSTAASLITATNISLSNGAAHFSSGVLFISPLEDQKSRPSCN